MTTRETLERATLESYPPSQRTKPFAGLLESLDRLSVASAIRLGSNLDQPLEPQDLCEPLGKAIEILRTRLEHPDRQVPVATLNAARTAWSDHKPDLRQVGERNARILCSDASTATSSAFVSALSQDGMLRRKRRCLDAMVVSYFHSWREMEEPGKLEQLLGNAVLESPRRTKRFEEIRESARVLFSPGAAQYLADIAVNSAAPTELVLQRFGASKSSHLGRAVAGQALLTWATQFTENSSRVAEPAVLESFRYGESLLRDPSVDREDLVKGAERLILWKRTMELEEFRQVLERALLSEPRLGDPRLIANRANWEPIPQGRAALVRWLSRRDLAFFFDFVMDQTEDPHGRKMFWSRYIDQVVDSTVALSPLDSSRLRVQVRERISHAHVTGTTDVSAFLMKFAGATDLTIVEFSRPGNALYIHDGKRFERNVEHGIRASSFHLREQLKGVGAEEAISHVSGWMNVVGDFLRSRGVRPR